MEFRKFIWTNVILLLISESCFATNPPYLLIKSLGPQNNQKIWSLTNQEQSDIRYDSDGDGRIDEWLLEKDDLKVNIYFSNQQISKVKFSLKKSSTYLQTVYAYQKNIFVLENTWAIEKPASYMKTPIGTWGQKKIICPSSRDSGPFSATEVAFIRDSSQMKDIRSRWDQAIDSSCTIVKEPIQLALRDVFDLPVIPKDQKNLFVECLNSNPQTQFLVTDFVRITARGPDSSTIGKIECEKTTSRGCGKAMYQSTNRIIKLPFSEPSCGLDMRSVYRQQVYHESLHSISPCLSEDSIVKIVDSCEGPKRILTSNFEKSNSLKAEIDRCHLNNNTMENSTAHVATPQAQIQKLIAESAQLKVTNIPKSIAEGSLAIPSPEPQTSGMVALNNSFQESRGPASASVTIPLQQSIAMSAPFFKAAAKVFSNYKLEPMQGQAPITTQLASQKTPRAVAAPVNAEISQATASPSAEPASFAKADNSKPTAPESIESNAAQANPPAQAQARARSPEVGSGGARGIASAPSSNTSTSVAAKPRVSDDASIDQERAKVAQSLVKMSIPQAREYIKSNELNLERLKILILSQKNQRWGYKDPSRAAVLIQEVNGQLRIESQ